MSNTATNHPSKEELCEYALHENDEALFTHIEKCNSCSEYVDDIKNISHDISTVEEEEVPEHTKARILAIARCKRKCRGGLVIETWYKNPFLIGILTIGFILLLYAVAILVM